MPALPTLRYGKAGKAGTDGHEIYQELNALTIYVINHHLVGTNLEIIFFSFKNSPLLNSPFTVKFK
jgi:hypothetical protein